jgi:glycosyltransferase involved in cell wall biosynthesis
MTAPHALRVAIEATGILDPGATGISRYTRCLIEALSALPDELAGDLELVQLWRSSRWRSRQQLVKGTRLHHQMWRNSIWPLRRAYDVVHVPHNRMPPWHGPAYVSTIHDLYAAIGINHEDVVQRERQLAVYRELGARSARLICDSEHTRQDFLHYIGGDPDRVDVIHLGVSPAFRSHTEAETAAVRSQYRLKRPYLLFVGYGNANKNLQRLLQAFAQSNLRGHVTVALAGKAPPQASALLKEAIRRHGLEADVQLLGFVPDDALPALYSGAAAYLFPSLYEGFGLPILEAMASGVPVLTSTAASCPEVAHGHAALVDPLSVDSITAGLERVVGFSAAQCAAAQLYAQGKTWRETAERTMDVYRKAALQRL